MLGLTLMLNLDTNCSLTIEQNHIGQGAGQNSDITAWFGTIQIAARC